MKTGGGSARIRMSKVWNTYFPRLEFDRDIFRDCATIEHREDEVIVCFIEFVSCIVVMTEAEDRYWEVLPQGRHGASLYAITCRSA